MTTLRRRSVTTLTAFLLIPAAIVPATLAVQAAAADGPQYERILNGNFDSGVESPWWTSGNTPSTVTDGRLCAQIPGGTVNVWDSMIGQDDVPVESGQPYTLRFEASADRATTFRAVVQTSSMPMATVMNQTVDVTTATQTFTFTGTSPTTSEHTQVSFQAGGGAAPYTLCLDNISLVGGVVPPGGVRDFGSPVRVNQLGYLQNGPKRATYVTDETSPLDWRLLDTMDRVVAHGKSKPHGADAMSGTNVQVIDFGQYRRSGDGYRLAVGDQLSEPFALGNGIYKPLAQDALEYFYNNRSGIPIEAQYVGAERARDAGHLGVAPNKGDTSVPCFPGTCTYSLDVRGGWYDAGDHGKYVVNGALAAWQLLDQYEQSGDETLRIPEAGNKIPDVLDEAKWEIDFLLRMQAPSGMVHHKIHDEKWTGLPLKPAADPQQRYLYPPSTAATLNVAAVGARCARVYAKWDKDLAARCLAAADRAWTAAKANPAVYAPSGGEGGGAYDDTKVTDEFSWAAAELFATTGKQSYKRAITTRLKASDGFSWQETGGLADLALARVPWRLSPVEYLSLVIRIAGVADKYLGDLRSQGYANPYLPSDGKYVWGSNSAVANNAMIMATAYSLTRLPKYRDGALESLDYLLGRNAINQSYVTGYGERDSHNQHHRFWAKSLDPALPSPAPGSMAGGPNSGLQDPVAQRGLQGCAPATCYLDNIGSYSTNEVAVNWNSALAWITAFADSQSHRQQKARTQTQALLASPIDLTSGFYVNPNSTPKAWVNSHGSDSRAATINTNIASRPTAKWFGNPPAGTTIGAQVGAYVGAADNADKLPVLVAYNLPGRDACGGHSGGGAGSPAAYRTWISAFADSIGTRPAVVVIEPDALGDFECMTAAQIAERNQMLAFATQQFHDRAPNTWAYLDAGNAGWVPAATMAGRLQGAGVANARGFAVNVSNYYTTSASVTYANNVRTGLGTAKPFVIDTSRNGNGSNGEWCNPAGRKLGTPTQTGGGAEMLLWIKVPGDSDGPCGIAPTTPAGQFNPDLAVRLINGT